MNLTQRVVIAVGLLIIGGIALLGRYWMAGGDLLTDDQWMQMLGVAAVTAAIVVVLGGRRK